MRTIFVVLLPPVVLFVYLVPILMQFPTTHRVPQRAAVASSEPLLSDVIERERSKWGLPRGLIEAVISHESKFRLDAFNPETKSRCYKTKTSEADRRRCGSQGLMQVVERWHGPSKDWTENIEKGSAKLGTCYRRHKNIDKTAACYNGTGKAAKEYAAKVLREFQIWRRLG